MPWPKSKQFDRLLPQRTAASRHIRIDLTRDFASPLHHVHKKPRLSAALDVRDHVVEVDDEAVVDLVCKSHQPQHRTRAVVASLNLPSMTAQVASVFGDDLFVTQPPPLPAFDATSDELHSSLSPPSPPHVSLTATQLRRALLRQRLQISPMGKRRAELHHKYGELAARARHFDRSLAEQLAALINQYRQRQVLAALAAPPTRQSGSLDASERLARRIAQRDFEDGADYAQAWSNNNNHHSSDNNSLASPQLFATPTAPSAPPTGDWLTPHGPNGQQKSSNAVKRLQFYD